MPQASEIRLLDACDDCWVLFADSIWGMDGWAFIKYSFVIENFPAEQNQYKAVWGNGRFEVG